MESVVCVILAAGLGKRMGGDLPKVATKTREKSLIEHVLDLAAPLKPEKTIVVTGYRKEVVESLVKESPSSVKHKDVVFAHQEEQLGTGHAVQCALGHLKGHSGLVVILYGDAPLVRSQSVEYLLKFHEENKATLSLLSFNAPFPHPYGRIIRSKSDANVAKIVEAKDCSVNEALVTESNSGIYAVDSAFLVPAVKDLTNTNSQKEFYLTDIVERATKEGQTVVALLIHDSIEALGVNTQSELAVVNRELEKRQIERLIGDGVIVRSPESLSIDSTVQIAAGATVGPNVQLCGVTTIAAGVTIEGSAVIVDSQIGENAVIKFCTRIDSSKIGQKSLVGPFANIRPGCDIGADCKVGNFVETKNARMGDHAKASHLSYLGDCIVGKDANIGAGAITCNYDGESKNTTTIGDGAFIGSDSCLIAPVTIGDGAYVGAGSTISKSVPAGALALSRAPQLIREEWAANRKKQRST